MENLTKVNARLMLIWAGNRRRETLARACKGPYWKEVVKGDVITARRLNNAKPYYHRANALD